MKHKVIVEIDGIRHKMVSAKSSVEEPCIICSLRKECTSIMGSPCHINMIFQLEK